MDSGGGTTSDVDRRIKEADWGRIRLQLSRYAYACIRKRSWSDAEDFAHDAIVALVDPNTRSWDPTAEPDLFKHLGRLVRAAASAERKRPWRKREDSYDENDDEDQAREEGRRLGVALASSLEPAETRLIQAERDAGMLKRIHERFAKDARVLEVFALLEQRIDTIREQSEHLGCTFDEVWKARRRLAEFVAKVNKALSADSDGLASALTEESGGSHG